MLEAGCSFVESGCHHPILVKSFVVGVLAFGVELIEFIMNVTTFLMLDKASC